MHLMLDQKDGHPFPAEGSQEVSHYGRLPLPHTGHRLIEKQQARVEGKGPGDLEAAALSVGQVA